MPPRNKYTDPDLRNQIKEEVQAGDKGGAPGQWSARKAQMMAKEYKARGGSYNTDESKKDESQKNLTNWTKEEWQTKEGSGSAKNSDGSRQRYLPKKAWEQMDEVEKEATDEKKQEASKEGQQFVANTGKARQARKNVSEQDHDDFKPRRSTRNQGKNKISDCTEEKGDLSAETGQKRGRVDKDQENSETDHPAKSSKFTDTIGSRHDNAEPPAQQASISRLPKKGDTAYWKAMPGWVDGKVVEILEADKKADEKQHKASKDDPKIVLKSNAKSGKICVHKVDNVYFD